MRISNPTAWSDCDTASTKPLTLGGTQKDVASHGKRDRPCTSRKHQRSACPSMLLE